VLNSYPGSQACLTHWVQSLPGASPHVLEVGCGTGRWLAALNALGLPLAGIEPSEGMLARARARLPESVDLRQGRAEVLPWADASFDGVFYMNALHHVPDKLAALRAAFRVLRPGGKLLSIGLDPHTGNGRWYIYEFFPEAYALDLGRFGSLEERRSWLQAAGFEQIQSVVAEPLRGSLSVDQAKERGVLERSFTSQLTQIGDEAYEAGLSRIQTAAEQARACGTALELIADIDLYATIANKR
jgi:ubiquinone/menaquinone biosynthesis C-methylase UbiE